MGVKQLCLLLLVVLAANTIFADEPAWQFTDVTVKVIGQNPLGIGPVFDCEKDIRTILKTKCYSYHGSLE